MVNIEFDIYIYTYTVLISHQLSTIIKHSYVSSQLISVSDFQYQIELTGKNTRYWLIRYAGFSMLMIL